MDTIDRCTYLGNPPLLLETHQLVKCYGDLRAVDGVSFGVDPGGCFGLLGPNGAGKTTTLEMLEGITPPDSGQIHFNGQPRDRNFAQRIGIQFQSTALQDYQTVRETLTMFQALYRYTTPLDELIESCHLAEFIDQDTRKLSGGQRQRALLAIALVNDPELVFLDEPTTGLDPQSRRNFWTLIENIRDHGKTVLLTTHYMEEAQRLCDRIAIMDHGRIIAEGRPVDLLRKHFPANIIRLPWDKLPDACRTEARRSGNHAEIYTDDVNQVLERLSGAGADLDGLQVASPSLEDLFLELTGHSLRA